MVDGMTIVDLKTHILPSLLAGTGNDLGLTRAGLSTPLQGLALTAQALRFEHPAMPTAFQVEDAIVDPRPTVAEALRRPLVRFLRGKRSAIAGHRFETRIASALSAQALRLHPFDIPALDSFVTKHSESLGVEAMAWAQRQTPVEQKQVYFEPDALDDINWAQATPALAGFYIETRRQADAAHARSLIEAALPKARSQHRQYMVSALRLLLSADDRALLEGLAKDRALGVRTTAQALLTRLDTRDGVTPAAVERIRKGQAGFLKKRTTLNLELPATVKPGTEKQWLGQHFAHVSISAWANALALPELDLLPAAEKDDNLLLGFAISAIVDHRFDILDLVTRAYLPDAWEMALSSGFVPLSDLNETDFAQFAVAAIKPVTWVQDIPFRALDSLALLPWYLPDSVMRDVMNSAAWKSLLKDTAKQSVDLIDIMALLCPAHQRTTLRAQLASFDPPMTADALAFLDIMDALETTDA
jgi:hypothetical protein